MTNSCSSLPTRRLGKTGFPVTEIGFGAWALGADWGTVTEQQALTALRAGAGAGMNLIDTADIYGGGRSERIIGQFLNERPAGAERMHVITKMGRCEGWDSSADAVARAANGSLERLGVSSLDLVQLHCIPFDVLREGTVFSSLEKAKDQGVIENYGVSVETIEEALFCIRETGAASLQVIFNVFRQRVIDELLPVAAEHGVGIVARVPLASGLLSGKYTEGHRFTDDDHRHYNANGEMFNVGETFAGVPFDQGVQHARAIDSILSDECPGATLAQKALRWILDFDAVSTVIPGARSAEQAQCNAAASALPKISDAAHARLAELYRNEIAATVRGAY
ncbi:MAG: aryl-alcohol dehydrogenase-like predicted oxidoreductase [Verrucomicrobiales bacterium]|jgi:aryl-alcohol dehydrogenase-like predicted oxidoreductase